jgi:anti-sigma regulatory factor (Ser/Thr protein kinase)
MRFTVSLPRTTHSIGVARHALDPLSCELDDETLRNARLLMSELVTNAVRHAGGEAGEVQVLIACEGRCLHVEVIDHGEGFTPQPRQAGQDAGSGWGLHILDRLSSRWGVDRSRGTRVWFEMDPGAANGRYALTG